LDRDKRKDKVLEDVLRDLHTVISSEDVAALIWVDGEPKPFESYRAEHFAFKADLTTGQVTLGDPPGVVGHFEINTDALERFLAKHRHSRRGFVSPENAANACTTWLRQEMLGHLSTKPKPKDFYREYARTNFNINGRAFDRIWTETIGETGARWNVAGRPKSSR
jgi:hypothetical protein